MYLSALTVVLQHIKPLLAIAHPTTCVSQRSVSLPYACLVAVGAARKQPTWHQQQTSQCTTAVQGLVRTGATAADGLGGDVTYLVWMIDPGYTLTPMSALPGSSTCQLEMVTLLLRHSCTDGLRLYTEPCQSCCQAVLVEGFVGAPVHNPLHPSHPNAHAHNLGQHRVTRDQIDVDMTLPADYREAAGSCHWLAPRWTASMTQML